MTVSSPWVKELGFQSPQAGGEGRAQDFLVVGQVFDTYIAVEFPDGTLSLVSELFSLKRKIEDSKTTGPLGGAARCRRKGQIRSSSGQLGKFQSKMGLPSGDCFRTGSRGPGALARSRNRVSPHRSPCRTLDK
mmetsp:Transcript_16591/g.34007  ORF Transcript_16591/g.34007 Transcript_16591/m.34007 type:complete len:133 (-) Transcript_16591:1030-1428(-)